MPTRNIDGYEAEFTGELLEGTGQWGAYVSISAPSANPMHMTIIQGRKRVAADQVFTDQHAAEAEAERAAMSIVAELLAQPGH